MCDATQNQGFWTPLPHDQVLGLVLKQKPHTNGRDKTIIIIDVWVLALPADDPHSNPLYLDLTWPEFQPPPSRTKSNSLGERDVARVDFDSNLVTSNAFRYHSFFGV